MGLIANLWIVLVGGGNLYLHLSGRAFTVGSEVTGIRLLDSICVVRM